MLVYNYSQWSRPGHNDETVISGDTLYYPITYPTQLSQVLCIDWESNESFIKTLAIKSLFLNRFIPIANLTEGQSTNKINQFGVITLGW